jgi:hypothetical protein
MPYLDNTGLDHESYEAACVYYGADTIAQCEAEMRELANNEAIEYQDRLEASGPIVGYFRDVYPDLPF